MSIEPPDPVSAQLSETEKARQGVTGHGIRYVLFFGLLGVIIAFVIFGFAFSN